MYPWIYLGPIRISVFYIFLIVGVWAGLTFSRYLISKTDIEWKLFRRILILSFLFGMLGAKILFLIITPLQFPSGLRSFYFFILGGYVWYGGLIAGLATFVFLTKLKRLPTLKFLDVAALATCIGQAIGRLGCFFNGCCYGKAYPVQLYESFSLAFIALALTLFFKRNSKDGKLFLYALIFSSAVRLTLETLRGDDIRGFIVPERVSVSMLIAIMIFFVSVIFLLRRSIRHQEHA